MNKTLGQDFPEHQRELFLRDNCDKVEEMGYMKEYTHEELQMMKESLAEASIHINNIEVAKKDAMDAFKVKMKSHKVTYARCVEGLRNKAEFVNENCFKFIDHEANEVGYYNSLGHLVMTRPCRPEEMQSTIFKIKSA